MATLVLSSALSSAGTIAAFAGAYIGSHIDAAISSRLTPPVHVGEEKDLAIRQHDEGAHLPRVYGTARLPGRLIWATNFLHWEVHRTSGGKGTPSSSNTQVQHKYSISFAVALCEGEIGSIGRVWLDGILVSPQDTEFRWHAGKENQPLDPIIDAVETNAPAYCGVAYIVFEQLPLEKYGNRIPVVEVEVFRPMDDVASQIESVVLIPGHGEFALATSKISLSNAYGSDAYLNVHQSLEDTDFEVSLDQLMHTLPNLSHVTLPVCWFGNDLRAGSCNVYPAVETKNRSTTPQSWSVGNTTRSRANQLSIEPETKRPAFGGTPSDQSVREAIAAIKARRLKITIMPLLMMDIAPGSGKPDPAGGLQPAYPPASSITVPSSQRGTAQANTDIARFFGSTTASHIVRSGTTVSHSSRASGFSRMVLHYARLASIAGGVDGFLIGSELSSLTDVPSASGSYPAVDKLIAIAAQVRAILPNTKISYAAALLEYGARFNGNAGENVDFPLDKLWANHNIDAVGINAYLPLSDWRTDTPPEDSDEQWESEYDPRYLASQLHDGEYFRWVYNNESDRQQQRRTEVPNSAIGKRWIFRPKAIAHWWVNRHVRRSGGNETTTTAWQPLSKPVWFTATGCPAIDGGARTPWRRYHPIINKSEHPPYSNLSNDDEIQRSYLRAIFGGYLPGGKYFDTIFNPYSSRIGQRMIVPQGISVWGWDVRPYPAFPADRHSWVDTENYHRGHWLNGRIGWAPVANVLEKIAQDSNTIEVDTKNIIGSVKGYSIQSLDSIRSHMAGLMELWGLQSSETNGRLLIGQASNHPIATITEDDVVQENADEPAFVWRQEENGLTTRSMRLVFSDHSRDYTTSSVLVGNPDRAHLDIKSISLPGSLDNHTAANLARQALARGEQQSTTVSFRLGPKFLHLEAGDTVIIQSGDLPPARCVITSATGLGVREITARRVFTPWQTATNSNPLALSSRTLLSRSLIAAVPRFSTTIIDLPQLSEDMQPWQPLAVARSTPWPARGAVLYGTTGEEYSLMAHLQRAGSFGQLISALPAGVANRRQPHASAQLELFTDALASATYEALTFGANALAVQSNNGEWEVLQFQSAQLIAPNQYIISNLLRGNLGTEPAMEAGANAGAVAILINNALTPIDIAADARELTYTFRTVIAGGLPSNSFNNEVTHTSNSVGLRPRRVAALRARWLGDNLEVRWHRRARYGGNAWSGEVPLDDDQESYRVSIWSSDYLGGASPSLIHETTHFHPSNSAGAPSLTIARALLTAAVPASRAALVVRVQQIGTLYGAGVAAEVVLPWHHN